MRDGRRVRLRSGTANNCGQLRQTANLSVKLITPSGGLTSIVKQCPMASVSGLSLPNDMIMFDAITLYYGLTLYKFTVRFVSLVSVRIQLVIVKLL